MSLRDIPLQCSFLYNEKWSEETDGVFIDLLLEQRREGHWNPSQERNFHALLSAHGVLNDLYSARVSWEDILERTNELRRRYDTFKYILEQDKVWWDRSYNIVRAERATWRYIIKYRPFAKAYYYEGEPQYDNLELLFKPEDAPPNGMEVIVVSDDVVPYNETPNPKEPAVILSDDEDEVASPVYVRSQSARKKLWEERVKPKFNMHLIDEDNYSGSANSPKEEVYKLPKAGKLKKGGPSNVDESSSCASSSPVKWFHFPGKKK